MKIKEFLDHVFFLFFLENYFLKTNHPTKVHFPYFFVLNASLSHHFPLIIYFWTHFYFLL